MAPKILITGLNGYLAGRTAEAVLEAGYDVRGSVRRLAAGNEVKDALVKLGYSQDRIEVVEVPDLTAPGAFDEAVAGCHAILHLASPVGEIFSTPPPEIVRRATSSTQGLLDSALAYGGEQLESVVYMSSTAAIFEVEPAPRAHDETDWNTTAGREVREKGDEAGPFNAYCAAKTAAERLLWSFREEKKPKFGVTAVQARYVLFSQLLLFLSSPISCFLIALSGIVFLFTRCLRSVYICIYVCNVCGLWLVKRQIFRGSGVSAIYTCT